MSRECDLNYFSDYFLGLRVWASLGQIKEMHSNEICDIIITVMIVTILRLWNMKGGGGSPGPLKHPPPPLDLPLGQNGPCGHF